MKITKHKTRTNSYELQVLLLLSQWQPSEAALPIFYNNFWQEIEALPKKSTGNPATFYKLIIKPDSYSPISVELWHLDATGTPDRHVATIEK